MPSEHFSGDVVDRRPARPLQPHHPPEPENLPCPRCDSTNTKFCYYNNYNLSQPRYFCKSCRRYWTRGGSLRNVPVGGGSRKHSKRARNNPASSASTAPPPPPTAPPAPPCTGSFTALLTCAQGGDGLVEMGGFGSGFDEVGLGFGFENTWQMGSGGLNGGLSDGADCFGWPELAMSTPCRGLE